MAYKSASKFFKAAVTFLLKKEVAFKYDGNCLSCAFFSLSSHVDLPEMWVEDDMGCWIMFTDVVSFKNYLEKRFPSLMSKR